MPLVHPRNVMAALQLYWQRLQVIKEEMSDLYKKFYLGKINEQGLEDQLSLLDYEVIEIEEAISVLRALQAQNGD